MADSNTTNHNFVLPEIGASKDTWGTKLNNNFSALDNILRTSTNSVFIPRIGGGNVTGGLVFGAHGTYDARLGQADFPLSVRRKSDSAVAFRFDGDAGIDGSAPDARSVMNRAMADVRYIRASDNPTFTGNAIANLLVSHATRVFSVRRKSDSADTHSIFDADITNPNVPSDPRSILTRSMGDGRYLALTGGNTVAGTQTHSGQTTYIGVKDGAIGIGGSGATPFYAQRSSDNLVTHVILDADITSPDDPSHARSILTRTMGDRRYPQRNAFSVFNAEQRFDAQVRFDGNAVSQVYVGQQADSAFYIARKSDFQLTHIITNDDVTTPNLASSDRSILTRAMGDGRYVPINVPKEGTIIVTRSGSGRIDIGGVGVGIQTGGPDQASLVYHIRARSAASSDLFRVLANGNVQNANNSYAGISDLRLKENIIDASPQLDDVLRLKVRNFNMRQGDKHKQIGLIAQEVQQIKPGLVEADPEGMLSVKYSVLVPILLKAIQELTAEVRSNRPVTAGA